MDEYDVAIVGSGPTGTMLAVELALRGVNAVVLERRATPEIVGSRSGGLHARTIELLDQRGVAERFLAEGTTMQVAAFAGVPLDISGFPTRHPYGLALWQRDFERILGAWARELGVRVRYGLEVSGLTQDADGVRVDLVGGAALAARYLVGADGGRSLVRKAAGIDFPGWGPTVSNLLAEVEMRDEPEWGVRRDEVGTHGISRMPGDGPIRVLVTDREVRASGDATLDDLRAGLVEVWGTDFGAHSPTWITRFTDATRQAASYRVGRVLLAGDSAHIHYPVGGQGLNLGIQDAVNLGWKLAQVVRGTSPDALLDTYETERHPVAARVLQGTMAQVALGRPEPRAEAATAVVAELLALDDVRTQLAGRQSGLDIRYDLGEGPALLGRRMPDLDLVTADGVRRVYSYLRDARAVLIDCGESGAALDGWRDRVQLVEAHVEGPIELPVLGPVPLPEAVLVRPDGHVAWTAGSAIALGDALTTWFGGPAG